MLTKSQVFLSTSAGTIIAGMSGVAGLLNSNGVNALFHNPMGLAVDPRGEYLYIVDSENLFIRRLTISSKAVVSFSFMHNRPAYIAVDNNYIYMTSGRIVYRVFILNFEGFVIYPSLFLRSIAGCKRYFILLIYLLMFLFY